MMKMSSRLLPFFIRNFAFGAKKQTIILTLVVIVSLILSCQLIHSLYLNREYQRTLLGDFENINTQNLETILIDRQNFHRKSMTGPIIENQFRPFLNQMDSVLRNGEMPINEKMSVSKKLNTLVETNANLINFKIKLDSFFYNYDDRIDYNTLAAFRFSHFKNDSSVYDIKYIHYLPISDEMVFVTNGNDTIPIDGSFCHQQGYKYWFFNRLWNTSRYPIYKFDDLYE